MPAKGVHFYRPQTSVELAQQARHFAYDPQKSFGSWLRYADAIKKQADGYARRGEEQYAYLLYNRYRVLILDLLPSHPEIGKDRQKQTDLTRAGGTASSIMAFIDASRPSIDRRARHFSDAGRGKEEQTATETGMPSAESRRRRRRKHSDKPPDTLGTPKTSYANRERATGQAT